ncbi:siderophore-interacting protein [Phaeobacter sp. CNT1-3]|nr:siderophore-interacting protein [Phaeobacter sp. CNT1-3]
MAISSKSNAPRQAVVHAVSHVTPNMYRIAFAGAGLADFPAGCEGGYIKLIFPDAPRANPDRPVMRTYSIRAHDVAAGEITVDFALHGDNGGLATDWALKAAPGDTIAIGGPGTIKMIDPAADPAPDWYLIAGDMTAIPALMCNIERLPETAQGDVVVEVTSEADKQPMDLPAGMTVHWVVNPQPDQLNGALVAAIKELPWRQGRPFVWTACEFDSMRALRSYYRTDRGLARDQFYLSSYWRAGRTEDQHKTDKAKDSASDQPAAVPA